MLKMTSIGKSQMDDDLSDRMQDLEGRISAMRSKYPDVQIPKRLKKEFRKADFDRDERRFMLRFALAYPTVIAFSVWVGDEDFLAFVALFSGLLLLPLIWIGAVWSLIRGSK